MAISVRPRLDDLLAWLGERAGDIAVQCSDTGGIIGKLNRQISAKAVSALRSVFVPLTFGGRRWGLYEVGYLI